MTDRRLWTAEVTPLWFRKMKSFSVSSNNTAQPNGQQSPYRCDHLFPIPAPPNRLERGETFLYPGGIISSRPPSPKNPGPPRKKTYFLPRIRDSATGGKISRGNSLVELITQSRITSTRQWEEHWEDWISISALKTAPKRWEDSNQLH